MAREVVFGLFLDFRQVPTACKISRIWTPIFRSFFVFLQIFFSFSFFFCHFTLFVTKMTKIARFWHPPKYPKFRGFLFFLLLSLFRRFVSLHFCFFSVLSSKKLNFLSFSGVSKTVNFEPFSLTVFCSGVFSQRTENFFLNTINNFKIPSHKT